MDTTIFGDLLLSTLSAKMDEVDFKSLSRESLTLAKLESEAEYESGKDIEVKFRKERLPAGSYSGYDKRPMEHKELYTGGRVDWKLNDVTVMIDEETMVKNTGLNIQDVMRYKKVRNMPASHQLTMFDLFHSYNIAAHEDLDNLIAKQIFSDGFNDEGEYKDIEGFQVIMAFGEPYAGIDPNDERVGKFDREGVTSKKKDNIWDVRYLDLQDKRPVEEIDFANLCSDIRRGSRTSKIYVAMGEEWFNNLENVFEGDKIREDEEAIKWGFTQSIHYPRFNLTAYPEDYIEDGTMYGWMPKHLKLIKNRSMDKVFSGVMVQIDANVVTYRYKIMCNLRCDSRARCFRIDNALP